jgi:hypothetical protein
MAPKVITPGEQADSLEALNCELMPGYTVTTFEVVWLQPFTEVAVSFTS